MLRTCEEELRVGAVSESCTPGAVNQGCSLGMLRTIATNWAYAREVGPRVALVQSFNQWSGCVARPGENMDENFSTDVEPMAGGHGDQYLRALGEQARAFKRGV